MERQKKLANTKFWGNEIHKTRANKGSDEFSQKLKCNSKDKKEFAHRKLRKIRSKTSIKIIFNFWIFDRQFLESMYREIDKSTEAPGPLDSFLPFSKVVENRFGFTLHNGKSKHIFTFTSKWQPFVYHTFFYITNFIWRYWNEKDFIFIIPCSSWR